MKGTVALEGLEFFAYHGFYEEERQIGNKYIVDVRATLSVGSEWGEDNISHTLNYEKIYAIVKAVMAVPTKLLETIALNIIAEVKQESSDTNEVYVRISKENPPIGGICKYSTITLEG